MLPLHFVGGKWRFEQLGNILGAKPFRVPSATTICLKGRWGNEMCSSGVLLLHPQTFTSFLVLNAKQGACFSLFIINNKVYLNRSCLNQNTILSVREMYLLGKWTQGWSCGQIRCIIMPVWLLVLIQLSQNLYSIMDLEPSHLKIAESLSTLTLLYGM